MEQLESKKYKEAAEIKNINQVFLGTWLLYMAYALTLEGLRKEYGNVLPLLNNTIFSLVTGQLVLLIPCFFYFIKTKKDIKGMLRFNKIKPITIILLIPFTYALVPLLGFLNTISLLFSKNTIGTSLNSIITAYSPIVSVFIIAFIPCMVEELLFRGVIYNNYRKVNLKQGILLSGLLFGLFHMNINQFIYAFAMGIVFALVNEATDSLFSTMIIHFVINANSVLLQYLSVSNGTTQDLQYTKEMLLSSAIVYGVMAIFTTAIAVFLLIAIAKIEKRYEIVKQQLGAVQKEKEPSSLYTIPLWVLILICSFFMILNEL